RHIANIRAANPLADASTLLHERDSDEAIPIHVEIRSFVQRPHHPDQVCFAVAPSQERADLDRERLMFRLFALKPSLLVLRRSLICSRDFANAHALLATHDSCHCIAAIAKEVPPQLWLPNCHDLMLPEVLQLGFFASRDAYTQNRDSLMLPAALRNLRDVALASRE